MKYLSYLATITVLFATGSTVLVGVDGKNMAKIHVNSTGSKDRKFSIFASEPFPLAAGQHVVQVKLLKAGREGARGNIDWLQGVRTDSIQPQPT